jgi:hypothetical protein
LVGVARGAPPPIWGEAEGDPGRNRDAERLRTGRFARRMADVSATTPSVVTHQRNKRNIRNPDRGAPECSSVPVALVADVALPALKGTENVCAHCGDAGTADDPLLRAAINGEEFRAHGACLDRVRR